MSTFFFQMTDGTISIDNGLLNRLGKVKKIKCFLLRDKEIWITTEVFSKECELAAKMSRYEGETEIKFDKAMLENAGIDEDALLSVEYRDFSYAKPSIIIKLAC